MINLEKNPKKRVDNIYFKFSTIFRIILLVALVIELIEQRWTLVFVTVFALFLTFFPYFFEKRYNIEIPPELHLFIVLFIYASIYLGEVKGYYDKFLWWDTLLHAGSGFALGIIGFAIMYVLYKVHKVKASPSIISFFSFCFALALGALWEIFEFSMDVFFGFNMQKVQIGTGVTDTMLDLIVDSIGALLASIGGYFYLKKGDSFIYTKLINYFEKRNPRLFSKIR